MSEPSTSAVAVGLKTGAIIAAASAFISFLAVLVGFSVVPLDPGNKERDAVRRLAAGGLCAFTLGPMTTIATIVHVSWLHTTWAQIFRELGFEQPGLWAYFATAVPFMTLWALIGFWVVAIIMLSVQRRGGRDLSEILAEVRGTLPSLPGIFKKPEGPTK